VIGFGATPLKLAARAVKRPWGRIELPLFSNPDAGTALVAFPKSAVSA
jgi:hypothetical protein